ncbi:MAG: PIG-L family deacetylase [Coriobacteriales bacterium]|nr:PIG-L family deacetylase [Actinomycetes bacterium]
MRRYRVLPYVLAVLVAVCLGGLWWVRHPQEPPLAQGTALFLTPHPDDETFGMGQAISHQVRSGRRVVVVLMTDGEGSEIAKDWAANGGTDVDGDADIDRWDFGLARRAEFESAMRALGVSEWRCEGASASQGATGIQDGTLSGIELASVVESIAAQYEPVSYFTVMEYRGDSARLTGDTKPNEDHTALCEAVCDVAVESETQAYFYKPYAYYKSAKILRWAPLVSRGDSEDFERKKVAVQAYSGIAKRSTLTLWVNSQKDRDEYAVPLSWIGGE